MLSKRVKAAAILLCAAVFALPAQAQRHGGSGRTGGRGSSALRGSHRASRASQYPFYPDYFDSDYYYEPEAVQPAPQEFATQQPVQPPASTQAPRPPESLVMELEGDRWVRVTNHGASWGGEEGGQRDTEQTSEQRSGASRPAPRRTDAAQPPSESPATMLVFRDGHTEEIRKYVIVDQTIYAHPLYWGGGSQTRTVQLAELDIPTTLNLNRERGAKFTLPSGPNEVVVRP